MTEKLRQSLSAVIDNEADAFELRRVLDELGRDLELRGLWDRYHIIGNAIRGERARLPVALRDRVWEALGENTAPPPDPLTDLDADVPAEATARPAGARLGRYVGFAVAASVAFAVVLGFNGLGIGDDGSAPQVASVADTLPAAGTPVPEITQDARVTMGAEIRPADVQRAQAYMLHHAQQQALNQAGVMSFVKLATYEAP